MEVRRVRGVGVLEVLVGAVLLGAIWHLSVAGRVRWGMVSFAGLLFLVNWWDTRQAIDRHATTTPRYLGTLGIAIAALSVWVVLVTRPAGELPAYFAALAGFFFLEALRDVVLTRPSPVQIMIDGYPGLIAVCLVLGATADAIDVFQLGLVMIIAAVFLIRKSFQWTGAVINWYVNGGS